MKLYVNAWLLLCRFHFLLFTFNKFHNSLLGMLTVVDTLFQTSYTALLSNDDNDDDNDNDNDDNDDHDSNR